MSILRVRMLGTAAALVVFVYVGATAADNHVSALTTLVQSALKADMEWEWIDDVTIIGINGPGIAGIPVAAAFLLLLFGGLPLAVFGLLFERQWAGMRSERRRRLRVPYAVLTFQIVSTLLSGFLILTMGPFLLWSIAEGMHMHDGFLPSYLLAQTLAGSAAIPVWRRALLPA